MPWRYLVLLPTPSRQDPEDQHSAEVMTAPHGWYYLNAGKKQHAIRVTDMAAVPMQSAVCGCQVLAILPAVARWHADPEGLSQRDKCRQCVAILERETNV